MKHLILIILSLVVVESVKGQQIITINNGNREIGAYNLPPTRIVEIIDDGYVVTYIFDKATIIDDPLYNGNVMWNVAGFGTNDTTCEPAIPYRVDSFTVPEGYSAEVKLVDSVYVDLPYCLSPARPPLTDSGNESYTKNNVPEISPYQGFLPIYVAREIGKDIYRGKKIINILVSAVQYNYEQEFIRAYTKISYKVSFVQKPVNIKQSISGNQEHMIDMSDTFLNNITVNGLRHDANLVDANSSNKKKGYLILSTPKFNSSVEKFANWKKLLGFDVYTILKDAWTSETVKQEVKKQYEANSSLYYLLIIGDNSDVPAQTSSVYSNHVTDFYYSCMDGDTDLTPDLLSGRLPVSTDAEANIIVDKIINYEKSPVNDVSFYKTGLNCAYYQDDNKDSYADRRFAQTSEEIRSSLVAEGLTVKRVYKADSDVSPLYWNNGIYSFGESIPSELKKPNFPWSGNASDINSAINEGAFYVLHRDHGGITLWGDPQYTISDINSLSNGNKLPVVFSMNCLTGKFNNDCFCEAFLKKENGGCVAIFGATEVSFSGYNDALSEGMFDAIWPSNKLRPTFPGISGTGGVTPSPTYELGQVLNQGKERLTETYGKKSSKYTKYTKELFHCFGDPSMKIYTGIPTAFSNISINRGSNAISVNLNGTIATIAFYDLVSDNVTYTTGTAATYSTNHASNVSVCISSHNRIPYINEGIPVTSVYIQNETVVGPANYEGSIIKVGSSVTTTKSNGPVIFKSGKINLKADTVVINSDTTIKSDTEFKISNK